MFLLDIIRHDTHNENICDLCGDEFVNYEDLIAHARHCTSPSNYEVPRVW